MIKFAVLTPSLGQPGGAERALLIKIRYADPTRLRCTGVALSGWGALDENLGTELRQHTAIHGDIPRGVVHRRPRSHLVQTTHPDLASAVRHVCGEADVLFTWGSLAVGRFTAGLRIPVICEAQTARRDPTYTGGITGITHLVAVSQAAREFFAGVPGVNGMPVMIIPNGVEVDRVCPRRGRAWQREQWGVNGSDKVLLYLGRQAPDKNPWACIQAIAKLSPDHKLIMVGNQSHNHEQPLPRLVESAAQLGVTDRVKFLPPTQFVGDALAGADCLLHLSLSEADSLVVKEAFLAGLPVVHTPVGSIPDLEDEFGPVGWGVQFRPGVRGPESVDPYEVAAQALLALSDTPQVAAVTNKMRALVWERWTGPAVCGYWTTYLEEVVAAWTAKP